MRSSCPEKYEAFLVSVFDAFVFVEEQSPEAVFLVKLETR